MRRQLLWAAISCCMAFAWIAPASPSTYKWVDEKGVTQYGDRVPPQYKDRANIEYNRRGVVVKSTPAAMTPEQRRQEEEEKVRQTTDAQKEIEQRRQDTALLNTYSTPEEMDRKRDRDLQYMESTIQNLRTSLSGVQVRRDMAAKQAEIFTSRKKPMPPHVKEEIAAIEEEKKRIELLITNREQDLVNAKQRFAEQRQRLIDLRKLQDSENANNVPRR